MKTKPIVDWDIDEATYIGSEEDGVDWNTLNTFSELMFNIKYNFGQSEFDLLIAKPDFAKFMTLEESELTEELASELQEKIDFLQWSWKPASMKDQAK